MWGRTEAMEIKIRIAALRMTAIFFLSLPQIMVSGQVLPEGITKILELEVENGGADLESMVTYYESLMERPMNINKASRADLQRLSVLSDFQIESIIEYRTNYGEILTLAELSLVDGFNEAKVALLKPFITLGPDPDPHKKRHGRVLQKAVLRVKRTYSARDTIGVPYYFYSKYALKYGEKLQVGFTLENDPFESICPDFFSVHIQAKDISLSPRRRAKLVSAVVGDYSLRMGQGLAVWNSFSLSALGDPSSIFKKESEVIPYTSSDEQNFFRGAGASFLFGKNWTVSAYYSHNYRDARVDKKYYYSLPEGGIHVSASERASRKKLSEHLGGCNASFRGDNFKVGLTAVFYSFDKLNRRRVTSLNEFQMYDGWWGNIALDAHCTIRRFKIFAEGAIDIGGAAAALAGGILPVSSSLEFGLLLRSYSKRYIAPHAGAYSSSSKCAGENGILLNGKWSFLGNFVLRGTLDLISSSSKKLKFRGEVGYDAAGGNSASLRFSYSLGEGGEQKTGIRLSYLWKGEAGFFAGAKIEGRRNNGESAGFPVGMAVMAEGGYTSVNEKWGMALSGSIYHVDNWDDRIYFYERDLPQTFSVPALYGRGWSVNGYFYIKVLRWMSLYLKASDKGAKMQLSLTF